MNTARTEIIARAVVRRDGDILLVKQRTKDWSFLPGGHVEPGERVEDALIREIAEELGTDAKIAGFVGVVEHGYVEDGAQHHELNLVFEVTIADLDPTSREDHIEFHWLPVTRLVDTDIRPAALKNVLPVAEGDSAQYWQAWNG
ncbi:NUDIX domain-containing protein [Nocardia aurea]|uniref:NUDIX domain-containing protein n=2 Tax=Nocardiaceae TaxID=85025 RepID=A0ABV3G2Z1_9NOCA